jgi:hypothetical protein
LPSFASSQTLTPKTYSKLSLHVQGNKLPLASASGDDANSKGFSQIKKITPFQTASAKANWRRIIFRILAKAS